MRIIALMILITGCSTPRDYHELTKQVGEYGLQVYEDKKRDVLCYVYRDDDSPAISCLDRRKK